MKTLLTNSATKSSITLTTTGSKAEQYREAVAGGCDLGRTSFMNILSGKVKEAKGWVLEVVKPEPKKVTEAPKQTKVFGMTFGKEDAVKTTKRTASAPRKRRDLEQVFANARKGKHSDMVNALEAKGFELCDVEKTQRWFCLNIPSVQEAKRNATRIDVSPLKNGGVNISLYSNDRAVGVKKSLKAEDATVANIVKLALHKDFVNA